MLNSFALQFQKSVQARFGVGALLVRNTLAKRFALAPGGGPAGVGESRPGAPAGAEARARPTRFVGVVQLDALRGLAKAGQVFESVVHELDRASGPKLRITLEIQAEAGDGFPEDVEAVVTDNAATLGFTDKRFD